MTKKQQQETKIENYRKWLTREEWMLGAERIKGKQ
jgi:hypothetical protein